MRAWHVEWAHPGRRCDCVVGERRGIGHGVTGSEQRGDLTMSDPGVARVVHDRHHEHSHVIHPYRSTKAS